MNIPLVEMLSTVFLWLTFFCSCNLATLVTVEQGRLIGKVSRTSRNGTVFYAYYAIPYAKPPIGDLRFEPPQEPDSWEGARTARDPLYPCMQMKGRNQTTGHEDCLHLNVFTPNRIHRNNRKHLICHWNLNAVTVGAPFGYSNRTQGRTDPAGDLLVISDDSVESSKKLYYTSTQRSNTTQTTLSCVNVFPIRLMYRNDGRPKFVTPPNLLPVLVYVHGGAFQHGRVSYYDPMYLMDYPIVFVTIQFRLSMFGFLSTADETLPGNMGMKDQVAALKWIQKNIAAFGGDPKRVTIAGSSSGAMSVHLHMYSRYSAGLFHRAMSLGGTAFHLDAITPSHIARERAKTLGTLFNCGSEIKSILKCLKKVPARDLALSLPHFYDSEVEVIPYPFAVVIEDEHDGAFLTKNPWESNVLYKVPWIVGITADEGCILVARLLMRKSLYKLLDNYEQTFPRMFSYQNWVDSRNSSIITAALRRFYFNNRNVGDKDMRQTIKLYSDASYTMSSIEAIRHFNKNRRATYDAAPVYVYLYDHRNTHSTSEIYGNTAINFGVCHGDDLLSFFHRKFFPPVIHGLDLPVSKRMVEYAVNFMHKGNPNGDIEVPTLSTNSGSDADEETFLPDYAKEEHGAHEKTFSPDGSATLEIDAKEEGDTDEKTFSPDGSSTLEIDAKEEGDASEKFLSRNRRLSPLEIAFVKRESDADDKTFSPDGSSTLEIDANEEGDAGEKTFSPDGVFTLEIDANEESDAGEENLSRDQPSTLQIDEKEVSYYWFPVRSSNLEYLHIRTNSDVMEQKLFNDRYIFWKKYVYSSLKNPYKKF